MTKFEDEFINDRMEDQMMKWIILQLVRKLSDRIMTPTQFVNQPVISHRRQQRIPLLLQLPLAIIFQVGLLDQQEVNQEVR